MNFADFQRNNSIRTLKKYLLQQKFMFQKLVLNFTNLWLRVTYLHVCYIYFRVSTIREVMEKSGNFVKISPNQGTLHFCLLNVAKKSPNRRYQKEEARGEGNETKFKKKKRLKLS